MIETVSRNNSSIFISLTPEQLLVLEEILEKEVGYYLKNRMFQQFVKDCNLLSIRDERRSDITRYQNIGKIRLKVVKALNAVNDG